MRSLCFIIIILFQAACGSKETSTTSFADTLEITDLPKDTSTVAYPLDDPALDSMIYIGDAWYFLETNEVFTTLYMKPGLPKDFSPELGTAIIADAEIVRRPISKKTLRAFVLPGLEHVTLYNEKHQKIADMPFVRGESYEDGISSQYIAVFKAGSTTWEKDMLYYCVSKANNEPLKDFSHVEFDDLSLSNKLITKLHKDTTLGWVTKHYKVMPTDVIYSVMSTPYESLLTEFANGEVKILNAVKNDFTFDMLLPLPYQVNGKPLMLIYVSLPESDVTWNYLAKYQNDSYISADYNRIPVGTKR